MSTKPSRGRIAPPAATRKPQTLSDLMTELQDELGQLDHQIADLDAQLRTARERAAYVRGRLESYASIQIIDNPATVDHGQEDA